MENTIDKYKEVLSKVKPLYERAKKENCPIWSTYEYLFPELTDSEDERIRKELINFFKVWKRSQENSLSGTSNWRGINTNRIITWLEKQKEPKDPFDDEQFKRGYVAGKRDGYNEGYKAGQESTSFHYNYALTQHDTYQQKFNEQKQALEDLINQYKLNTAASSNADDLKAEQKEQKPIQKPINWAELTWEDINTLERIINNVHYDFRNGIGEESFGKEVIERFRETKGEEYLDEREQELWKESEQKPTDEKITDEEMECSMNELYNFKVFAVQQAKENGITWRRDIHWHNFCAGLLTYLKTNQKAE